MNNEIAQNEKIISDLTADIISDHYVKFKEKGIAFRIQLNTSKKEPYESKITIDLLYDEEIVDFIEFFVYEKEKFIKDVEGFKKWLNASLDKTYQNLIQYD
jgi:hypothetical protein